MRSSLKLSTVTSCPPPTHTQVRSGSKLIPGIAHDGELLGKRVEVRLEICGFNTLQDARLLEILMK